MHTHSKLNKSKFETLGCHAWVQELLWFLVRLMVMYQSSFRSTSIDWRAL